MLDLHLNLKKPYRPLFIYLKDGDPPQLPLTAYLDTTSTQSHMDPTIGNTPLLTVSSKLLSG